VRFVFEDSDICGVLEITELTVDILEVSLLLEHALASNELGVSELRDVSGEAVNSSAFASCVVTAPKRRKVIKLAE
jgi:hypothetical protein